MIAKDPPESTAFDLADTTDRCLAEAAPVPMLVHVDWRVLWANLAASSMALQLGLCTQERPLTGSYLLDFLPPLERQSARSDRYLAWRGIKRPLMVRSLITSNGQHLQIIGAGRAVVWEGQAAMLLSFFFLAGDPDGVLLANVPGPHRTLGAPAHDNNVKPQLTERQTEIALLLADGYTPLNIAHLLDISVATVRTHMRAIYRKTGCHSRSELVRYVLTARFQDEDAK